MQIMNRAKARELQLSQYFTGLPCRNGHVEKRYTQSGTCAGCIRKSNTPNQVDRSYLKHLIEFKVRIFSDDLELFTSMVFAAAISRDRRIMIFDIRRGSLGQSRTGETAIHRFRCFPEDEQRLRESALELFRERAQ